MRLETIIDPRIKKSYTYKLGKTISFDETFDHIIKDLKQNIPLPEISAKFHNTLISVILDLANKTRESHHLSKVVLSGGTFQNKYLLENVENILIKNNFEVYSHKRVPTNDGGLALGQLVIAAKKSSETI
jgi:hydrogenase maturation protein HypF